jgi:hypothetical protein
VSHLHLERWSQPQSTTCIRLYNKLLIGDRTTVEHFDGPQMIHGVATYEFLKEKLGWK